MSEKMTEDRARELAAKHGVVYEGADELDLTAKDHAILDEVWEEFRRKKREKEAKDKDLAAEKTR